MRTENRAIQPVADSPNGENPVVLEAYLESCRYNLDRAINCGFQDDGFRM